MYPVQAFVSVLDIETVIYVWDQCFMQRWKSTVLEDFCLAILLLLRTRFMLAKDYSGAKRVIISHTSFDVFLLTD